MHLCACGATTPLWWKGKEKVSRIHHFRETENSFCKYQIPDTGITLRNPSTDIACLYQDVRVGSGCWCCLSVECFSEEEGSPAAPLHGYSSDIPTDAGIHPPLVHEYCQKGFLEVDSGCYPSFPVVCIVALLWFLTPSGIFLREVTRQSWGT